MKFVINDEVFETKLDNWPEGSTFKIMHEGDRNADKLKLSNPRMTKESIRIIIDVVTKNITNEPLNPDNINWNDLKFIVDYLGIRSSVDYIYPLFLTIQDRIDKYSKDISILHVDEMKIRESDYDIVGKNAFASKAFVHFDNTNVGEILKKLEHIPGLFVTGEYPLSKFSGFTKCWQSFDIYGYSLDSILEGSKVCLEISKCEWNTWHYILPVRGKYSIHIPIFIDKHRWTAVYFHLVESRDRFHILNRFDIDSLCIGFDISNPNIFYGLPRFVRACETQTNTIDPFRQSPEYIERLIKYSSRGFNIAVPGLNLSTVKLSPTILWNMKNVKDMNLTGLQALVASAIEHSCVTEEVLDNSITFLEDKEFENILYNLIGKLFSRDISFMDGKSSPFIMDEIMNERQEIRRIRYSEIFYTPKYPKIELIADSHPVYRVPFYKGYYNAHIVRL